MRRTIPTPYPLQRLWSYRTVQRFASVRFRGSLVRYPRFQSAPIGPAEGSRSITNIDYSVWDNVAYGAYADGTGWEPEVVLGRPVYGDGVWIIPAINQDYYLHSADDGLTWSKIAGIDNSLMECSYISYNYLTNCC